ncbi:MAG TPA: GNAT family N-acetyltransferase [Thermomicrobiales bacterium]|nr:GNAT family N-acetyltransferase [Thermomicrobiales bacterium]
MDDAIVAMPYDDLDMSLRRRVSHLQDRAYGPSDGQTDTDNTNLHDPALNGRSFMLFDDGRLASYAGVLTTTIHVDGERFTASGLSCVATDPDHLRQGFASRVIAAATRYIESSGVDVGIFTSAPALAHLYGAAGDWQVAPDVVLIGSRDPNALTSTSLGVVVLMRLFSQHALANFNSLRRGTINLGLPVGQFW